MGADEQKKVDRRARFRHYATDFAMKLGRATIDERREALDHLHGLLKVLDAARVEFSSAEHVEFDAELAKPLRERDGPFNFPDDPVVLAYRAASLMREAAELSEEANELLRDAARRIGLAGDPW